MRHRPRALALLPVICVALAACGGSSSSSTTVSASSSTSRTAASSAAGSGANTVSSATAAVDPTASNPRPTRGASPSGGGSSGGNSVNARVPAMFAIRAGGNLTPTTVSAPAFLAVEVSIDSADASRHQVVLRTPTPHTFTVAAHGHASLQIAGLRAGAYAIDIDGAPKGSLIIGGEPGP